MRKTMRLKLTVLAALVIGMAGCGTSQPQNVPGLTKVIGSSLPGAQGLTISDQEKIDETVGRGCAGGVYAKADCDKHTKASAARRSAGLAS